MEMGPGHPQHANGQMLKGKGLSWVVAHAQAEEFGLSDPHESLEYSGKVPVLRGRVRTRNREYGMVSLLLTVVLAGVTTETVENHDYKAAYKESIAEHKPLMVVVGAEWCPACNVLKDTTIKPMVETGELDQVSVAVVDRDAEPELAKQLTKGEKMLPQIIVFSKTSDGKWERKKLMGYQPKQPVRQLIALAVAKQRG